MLLHKLCPFLALLVCVPLWFKKPAFVWQKPHSVLMRMEQEYQKINDTNPKDNPCHSFTNPAVFNVFYDQRNQEQLRDPEIICDARHNREKRKGSACHKRQQIELAVKPKLPIPRLFPDPCPCICDKPQVQAKYGKDA